MSQKKVQIEQLLEELGSSHIPEDSKHRYQLRRTLLCSRQFEVSRHKMRWNVILTYTAPLVAGTVVVGVFAFMATSLSTTEALIVDVEKSGANIAVDVGVTESSSTVSIEPTITASAFVSDASEPLVQLADFVESEDNDGIHFVPITHRGEALVR